MEGRYIESLIQGNRSQVNLLELRGDASGLRQSILRARVGTGHGYGVCG